MQRLEEPNLGLSHNFLNKKKKDDDTLISETNEDHVIDLCKGKLKEPGECVKTGTMILTFDRCNLLSHLRKGRNRFEVKEYIPDARRCFKRQCYNHSSKSCHAQQIICVNSGEPNVTVLHTAWILRKRTLLYKNSACITHLKKKY